MTTTTTTTSTTFEVQLAVYDLSRGMARSLSAQFLGGEQHALDIIPHTGLVVYGKEYFYGNGIQSAHPMEFRRSMGIFPIQTKSLGRTTVSQREFETWCANMMTSNGGRYSADAYDLLNRNCNHFCHDAALEGLRLSQGVPEDILDVPRRFLASPMGQMVRPMLENMQVTGGGGGGAPFATAAPPIVTNVPPPPPAAAASSNPWANMPPAVASTTENDLQQQGTPVLDSFKRPLLSNDTKTAIVCAKKLMTSATNDEDKAALEKIGSNSKDPTPEDVEAGSKAILHQLQEKQNETFALMLLRLVVLHPGTTDDNGDSSHVLACLHWVQNELITSEHSGSNSSSALTTAAARSMAWCVLSNALGGAATSSSLDNSSVLTDSTVEAALADIVQDSSHQPRVEVRQAAAAFLYNVALLESKKLLVGVSSGCDEELPDRVVSLLCASLDGVAQDEPDTTTQLRRILVAARLVKPLNCDTAIQPAKTLVQDLGFAEGLEPLINGSLVDKKKKAGSEQLYKLAKEFVSMINS